MGNCKVKTYGCDDCPMLRGKRCRLWQIKINDPHNSHCESIGWARANYKAKQGRSKRR